MAPKGQAVFVKQTPASIPRNKKVYKYHMLYCMKKNCYNQGYFLLSITYFNSHLNTNVVLNNTDLDTDRKYAAKM